MLFIFVRYTFRACKRIYKKFRLPSQVCNPLYDVVVGISAHLRPRIQICVHFLYMKEALKTCCALL